MDLRNSKRKLFVSQDISYKKASSPLSRDHSHVGTSEDDSFYSCTSNNQSIHNSMLEPKAFLEGTESFDHITIALDPNNPGIMPQEVTVYGYENALFMTNDRKRANRVMFSPNLTHSMSNLYISPQKLVSTSNSKQPFRKPIYTQDTNSTSGCNLLNGVGQTHPITSWQNEFINGREHKTESGMNLIPPCTQTIGHKIDPISRYVLTPNSDVGYLSNIQFNCVSFLPGRQTQEPNFHSTITKQSENIPLSGNGLPSDHGVDQLVTKSFECTLCHENYTKLTHYLAHLRSHIKLDTLVCEVCEEQISSASEIPNHISTHSGTDVFLCISCSSVFYNYNNLVVHLSIRKKGNMYSCPKCPMKFCSKVGFISHKKIHIGHQFECTACSLKFVRAFSLKRHLKFVHGNSKKEFPNLNVHRKKVETVLSRLKFLPPSKFIAKSSNSSEHCTPILCPYCSKKFIKERYLRAHIRRNVCQKNDSDPKDPESQKNIPPVCPHCSRVFLKEVYKKQHLRNRICQRDTSVNSSYLNESEHSQNLELSSIEVDHTLVYPICPNCSKVFKGKRTLRQHIRNRICKQVPEISTEEQVFNKLPENTLTANEGPLNTNEHTPRLINSSQSSTNHEVSYECPKCDNLFSKRKYRDYHQINCFPSKNASVMNGISIKDKSSDLKAHCVAPRNAIIQSTDGYICQHCHSKFLRISNFQKHVRDRVCLYDRTVDNNSLLNYKSLFARNRTLSCANCQIVMGSMDTLRRHERSGKCKALVNQTFGEDLSSSTSENLSDSIEVPLHSSNSRNQSLNASEKRAKPKGKLKRLNPGRQTLSKNKYNKLLCLYCPATFSTRNNFRIHLKLANCVKGISRSRTTCSACDRHLSTVDHLRRHVTSNCKFFKK